MKLLELMLVGHAIAMLTTSIYTEDCDCEEAMDGPICVAGTCGCITSQDCSDAGGGLKCLGDPYFCSCTYDSDCQTEAATGTECNLDNFKCRARTNAGIVNCECDTDCERNCVGSVDGMICDSGICSCLTDQDCVAASGGSKCFGAPFYCSCASSSHCQNPAALGPECNKTTWKCQGENFVGLETTTNRQTTTQVFNTTNGSTSTDGKAVTLQTTGEQTTFHTKTSVDGSRTTPQVVTTQGTTAPNGWEESNCMDPSDCPDTEPACDDQLHICTEEWVQDVEEMIDNRVDSLTISSVIDGHLSSSFSLDMGILGSTIFKLAQIMGDLVGLRETEDYDPGDILDSDTAFTQYVVHSLGLVFMSYEGWRVVPINVRHHTSALYLGVMDKLGFLFGTRHVSVNMSPEFHSHTVSLQIHIDDSPDDGEKCLHSHLGSICADLTKLGTLNRKNIFVGSFVRTKIFDSKENSVIFPNMKEGFYDRSTLGIGILGLTINGKGFNSYQNIVRSRFLTNIYKDRTDCEFVPHSPACVHLDLASATWLDNGCEFVANASSQSVFTCHCQHLTNFGILLDWQGSADPRHPVLSKVSYICLSVSSLAIVLAEMLNHFEKEKVDPLNRRRIELNRNIFLFLAQVAFMIFVDMHHVVSCVACEIMGSILHLLWLTVFAWTGLEGITLYRALVKVFTSKPSCQPLTPAIGYAAPLLIVVPVLLTGFYMDSKNYLKRNEDDQVLGCYLHDKMMLTLVVPVGTVLTCNTFVAFATLRASYRSNIKRNIQLKNNVLGAVKNLFILSYLLGITWSVGFLPPWDCVQYIFVIVNGSSGIFILFFTFTANKRAIHRVSARMRAASSALRGSARDSNLNFPRGLDPNKARTSDLSMAGGSDLSTNKSSDVSSDKSAALTSIDN